MLYTHKKLKELLGSGTAHVRKPDWPEGSSVKTYQEVVINQEEGKESVFDFKGIWEVDLAKPASVPFLKKLLGTVPTVFIDGKAVKYQRKVNDIIWVDTEGVEHSTSHVLYSPELQKKYEDKKARESKYMDWVLSNNCSDAFTYGFELETHQSDGRNKSNWRSGLEKYATQRVEKLLKEKKYKQLFQKVNDVSDPTVSVLANISASKFDINPVITDEVAEHVKELLIKKGQLPMEYSFPFDDSIHIDMDESVPGFEFRTEGALTVKQFADALEQVYSINHTIETDCSMHIHIGSNKLELPTSREAQQFIINKVISDERVPQSVRKRWNTSRGRRFCNPLNDGNDDKYSFVRCHRKYGTLEFRCFGNIDNAADAIACRQIAQDALTAAMKEESLPKMPNEWESAVITALDKEQPANLNKLVDYERKLKELEEETERKKAELLAGYTA